MSVPQGTNTSGFTQLSSSHDHIPNRRVSDNFSSSHSYAPECKRHCFYSKEKYK